LLHDFGSFLQKLAHFQKHEKTHFSKIEALSPSNTLTGFFGVKIVKFLFNFFLKKIKNSKKNEKKCKN
jgi:hypothetical protein